MPPHLPQLETDMNSYLALALLLAAPQGPPAADLQRGKIVEKVQCAANPAASYALYLPAGYTADRAWPILYLFDPRSRGPLAAERFRAGAETHGYILASSNSSLSDGPMEPNLQSLRAMWADTHARFRIDDRRVYGAGFSGTVRFCCSMARAVPGIFAGIIGAGAGFPFDRPPQQGDGFVFFGTVGDKDFNYYEMMDLEPRLRAAGIVHHLEIFDGVHQWPPEPLATQALDWMELAAMKTGTRPQDSALVDRLWNAALARARAAEAAGDLVQAWRAWSAAGADFAGLRAAADTAEAERKAAELAANPTLQRELRERAARLKRDKQFLETAPEILRAVNPSGEPVPLGQVIAALKIHELRKKAQSAPEPDERLAAQRVLNTLGVQTSYYLPQKFLGERKYDQAIFVLSIAAEIDPESAAVWYNRAAAYARRGDPKKALADLRHAVETGWKDAAALEKDEDFAGLRENAEFRKVVAELKVLPPGPHP
jgi:tetratricopeptide (TPR) repeat protein